MCLSETGKKADKAVRPTAIRLDLGRGRNANMDLKSFGGTFYDPFCPLLISI